MGIKKIETDRKQKSLDKERKDEAERKKAQENLSKVKEKPVKEIDSNGNVIRIIDNE